MSDSIEEIITRSFNQVIDVNDSCELEKAIDIENDSLNLLKSIKKHLEDQGILSILFQIQKEIYTQWCEKQIQEYMNNQYANRIITVDDLKTGVKNFISSYHLAFNKLNSTIISIIGQRYSKTFFENSELNKTKSSPVKHMDELLDKDVQSWNESHSFYSELTKDVIKNKNESTIMKIMPVNDKEASAAIAKIDYNEDESADKTESEDTENKLGCLLNRKAKFTSAQPSKPPWGESSTKVTSSLTSQPSDNISNLKVSNNAYKTTIDLRSNCKSENAQKDKNNDVLKKLDENLAIIASQYDPKAIKLAEQRRLSALSEDISYMHNKENLNVFSKSEQIKDYNSDSKQDQAFTIIDHKQDSKLNFESENTNLEKGEDDFNNINDDQDLSEFSKDGTLYPNGYFSKLISRGGKLKLWFLNIFRQLINLLDKPLFNLSGRSAFNENRIMIYLIDMSPFFFNLYNPFHDNLTIIAHYMKAKNIPAMKLDVSLGTSKAE